MVFFRVSHHFLIHTSSNFHSYKWFTAPHLAGTSLQRSSCVSLCFFCVCVCVCVREREREVWDCGAQVLSEVAEEHTFFLKQKLESTRSEMYWKCKSKKYPSKGHFYRPCLCQAHWFNSKIIKPKERIGGICPSCMKKHQKDSWL